MFEELSRCNSCMLCKNQKPLLDKSVVCDIMWIGLSAKKVENVDATIPLCNDTNSGKVIELIEKRLGDFKFYKTNLVKRLPLDRCNKLRYPTIDEMNFCISNLLIEIDCFNPKIIFVLGKKTYDFIYKYFVRNRLDIDRIYDIEHSSYIYVYRKKFIDEYVEKVVSICKSVLI